jgi:hypothetical protein
MTVVSHNRLKCAALFVGLFLIAGGRYAPSVSGQEKLPGQRSEGGHGQDADTVSLQERILPQANPTAYEFGASLAQVTSAIQKAYEKHFWETGDQVKQAGGNQDPPFNALLIWGDKADGCALCQGVFDKPENRNDACLFGGAHPFGRSKVYFKNGLPLLYFADFHIHLTATSASKTRIEIFTNNPWVSAGLDESSLLGPAYIAVDVKPTTIEEYEILLKIGEQLGVKGMPRLVVPGPDSPTQQVVRPRKG